MKHGDQLDKIRSKIEASFLLVDDRKIQQILQDVVDYGDLCYEDGVQWALDQEGCR